MRDNNRSVGQLNAGVRLGNFLIVPSLDGAKIDSGKGGRGQLQRLLETRQIVGDANWPGALGDLQDRRHVFQLVVVERGIAGAEIDESLLKLLNTTTGTNRLVVDL